MASKKTERRKGQKAGLIPIMSKGKPGIPLTERHKEKLQVSAILNRLENHVLAKKANMAPHQVSAALGLLKKVMPDLASTHVTPGNTKSHEEWLDELEQRTDAEDQVEE